MLAKYIPPSRSKTMYRIVDSKGKIFSKQLGWQEITGEVYGHLFDKNEVPVVLEILKELGFKDIEAVKDKIGTYFVRMANSPFGNPVKMVILLIVTVLVFLSLYIVLNTDFINAYVNYVESILSGN